MSEFAETYRAIDLTIRKYNRFLVASHVRPDGDAIGSQLALGLLLRDLGKQVEVWNNDPVPAKYTFLPHAGWVKQPPAQPVEFEVVFAVDNASLPRLGRVKDAIAARKYLINIDHHASNDGYGDLSLIDPESPATGQVLYEFFRAMNYKITVEMATCLYAAIATDTGSFQYPNTTARCLRDCADLIDLGVDVAAVSKRIYENFPIGRLRLLQKVLDKMRLSHGGKVGSFWITKDMYEETGAKPEDNEGLIDHVRSIDSVVVAVSFEEAEDNRIRLSLRSKNEKVDVNRVAMHFGGGGHAEAAGARVPGKPDEVERAVLDKIGEVLAEARL
jgi:phosphoesterase RecJ-like protein